MINVKAGGKQMRHVPPKHQLTFNKLHGIISQKKKPFIITSVRTSNPTFYILNRQEKNKA
jgi:hypothetical protein